MRRFDGLHADHLDAEVKQVEWKDSTEVRTKSPGQR